MTAFDRLLTLAHPPANPVNAGSREEFAYFEIRLGTKLPDDFKSIINSFGSGEWLEFYWILNPFEPHFERLWDEDESEMLRSIRESHRDWPQFEPYTAWPEPRGLLPWGGNSNGGFLCWIVEGEPATWKTVYRPDRTPEFEEYDESVSELLVQAITGMNDSLSCVPYSRSEEPVLFCSDHKKSD